MIFSDIKNSVYAIISDDENETSFKKRKQNIRKLLEDEVLIEHEFIGFNHYDLDHINNFKKNKIINPKNFKEKFFIPGIEAIGKIKALGKNVKDFSLNERVLYVTSKNGGGYAEYNIVHKNLLIVPPKEISSKDALVIASRGIMGHMLLKKVYMCSSESVVLITNPTGALGHIIAQLANFLNIKIIGAIRNDQIESLQWCKNSGYFDAVVNLDEKGYLKEISDFTNGIGINLAIDTIGGKNLSKLIDAMSYCGVFLSLGQNSGAELNINARMLMKKSIFLTRPSLFDYKEFVHELRLTAFEVFNLYEDKKLKPIINKIYKFDNLNDLIEDANNREIKFANLIKI